MAFIYDSSLLEDNLIKIRSCTHKVISSLKQSEENDYLVIKGIKFPLLVPDDLGDKYQRDKSKLSIIVLKEVIDWSKSLENKKILLNDHHDKIQSFLTQVEQFGDDHYGLLAKALLWSKLQNIGAFEKSIKNFLSLDPKRFIFYDNALKKLEPEWSQYIIEEISSSLANKRLKKAFLLYLDFIIKDSKELRFVHEQISDLSLQEIRKAYRSINYGYFFPNVWFPIIFMRANVNEAYEFLEKSFEMNKEEGIREKLWLLEHHLPKEEFIRDKIVEIFSKDRLYSNVYLQDTFYTLIDNDRNLSFFSKHNLLAKKPVFNMKRKLYRKMLKSSQSLDYAIYRLLELGDYQEDILWWKVSN